jgi:hypothetical protein
MVLTAAWSSSIQQAEAWTRQKHGQGRSMDKAETWSRNMEQKHGASRSIEHAAAWSRSMEDAESWTKHKH